jgi:protein MpaA
MCPCTVRVAVELCRGPKQRVVVIVLTVVTVVSVALAGRAPGSRAARPSPSAWESGAPRPAELVGRSVRGRAIVARVVGDPTAPTRVLIVGCIHGTEPAGIAITRLLRNATAIAGVALWLVDAFNPDGCAAHTRQNAAGVDLNRNSPAHWRPLSGIFYSGPRPLSEPESQAINGLVTRLRPAITIWYHQHAALVDDSGGDRAIERRYARLVGLPFRHYGDKPGSITRWQNATFSDATAFVVELPAGRLAPRAVARHARAVVALARAAR